MTLCFLTHSYPWLGCGWNRPLISDDVFHTYQWSKFDTHQLPPHSWVVKKLDDPRDVISREVLSPLNSWKPVLVLNAKRLFFRKWACVVSQQVVRVNLLWFWHALIPHFPFRKKKICSPPSVLFGLNFCVPEKSPYFVGKVSFFYTFMLGFDFLSQECPQSLFSSLD